MIFTTSRLLGAAAALTVVISLSPAGVGSTHAVDGAAAQAPARKTAPLPDKPLPAHTLLLLDAAFDVATAIPIEPHIKSRSRKQERVFNGALKLEQVSRAERYLKQIDNWRRGSAYGELALYSIRHGRTGDVPAMLELAADIAKTATQDWRRGVVMNKVAQARVLLGQAEQGQQIESGLQTAEQGAVALAQAGVRNDETFDAQVKALDGVVATGQFDSVRNAMQVYVTLYHTYHDDAQRRQFIQDKLAAAGKGVPLFLQVDALLALAEKSIDRGDLKQGLAVLELAQGLVDGATWPTDFFIPLSGRMASARARCGDVPGARKQADAALKLFSEHQESIQNFEQADALRPVAEAYRYIGDSEQTRRVYRLVVEVGAVNPNARCRAEDLTETCLSMALHGYEPDEALWARVREIEKGLDHPW